MIEAAGRIEGYDTIAGLWSGLLQVLSSAGLPQAIYITVDADGRKPFVLTNVPDVYSGTDPASDPFLSHICTSYDILPTGPEYLPDYGDLPASAKAFIQAAGRVDWRTGLGIPMRLQGSERWGGFNLGCGLSKTDFETRIRPRAESFRFICLMAHRRIEELTRGGLPPAESDFRDLLVAPDSVTLRDLSPREKEVIYFIAQGISRKECARMCGISPHTVAEYTKSAYRKLGVSNRVAAARLVLDRAG